MLHRVLTAPLRWVPCIEPLVCDATPYDRFEPREARAPCTAQALSRQDVVPLEPTAAYPIAPAGPAETGETRQAAAPLSAGAFAACAQPLLHTGDAAALGTLFSRLSPAERSKATGARAGRLPKASLCALLGLLPPAGQAQAAQAWLLHPPEVEPRSDVPLLRALAALLSSLEPDVDDRLAFPELALLVEPKPRAASGLPAWAQRLLAEAPRRARNDALPNTPQASLARFLLACRAAAVPVAVRDAAAPAVAVLLALPEEPLRRALLWRLAGALSDPAQAPGVLAVCRAGAAKALPLRLAVQLFAPDLAAEPGLQAALRGRRLRKHGDDARGLIQLLIDAPKNSASAVLALTRPEHVRRVLGGPAQAAAIDAALQAARQAAASQGNARTEALRHLDAHQAQGQALAAAFADLQGTPCVAPAPAHHTPVGKASLTPKPAVPRTTLEALRRALLWLAEQPALSDTAGPAARLCTPSAARHPRAQGVLAQCRAAVRTRGGWQAAWCAALLRDLHLMTAPPATAPAYPSPAVQTVIHAHVTPLMLALAALAPLLREAGRAPRDFVQASEVLPTCLKWTGLTPAAMRRAAERGPHGLYLLIYRGSILKDWSKTDPAQTVEGHAILKQIFSALANPRPGSVDALRRQGAQARLLLGAPKGEALLAAWERCEPTAAAAPDLGGHTVEDTGDPGSLLAAVTELRSCQSARDGLKNQGMLSRLSDGAKRMALLRDARGKLRARAMLRLMRTPQGRPVLLMSRLYVATGTRADDARQALRAHVRQRAAMLGVQAVCEPAENADLPAASALPAITCESGPGDYWDELRGCFTRPITLWRSLRELAGEPTGAKGLP